MKEAPKRSNEPVVWLLFGAGGSISAVLFPILAIVFGLLLPFGLVSADNLIAFAGHWFGKLVILATLIFPMWCAMHRLHHGLHDFKIHLPASGWWCYGIATFYSLLVVIAVL